MPPSPKWGRLASRCERPPFVFDCVGESLNNVHAVAVDMEDCRVVRYETLSQIESGTPIKQQIASVSQRFRTIALYKPYGVLCQFRDASGRPTLASLVPIAGIYPAGRLDFDSEGLLLLTDDGGLAHRLTDPRFAHAKTYLVQVERVPDADGASMRCATGVVLRDGMTRPAQVELLEASPPCPTGRSRFAFARTCRPRGCGLRSRKDGTARCAG